MFVAANLMFRLQSASVHPLAASDFRRVAKAASLASYIHHAQEELFKDLHPSDTAPQWDRVLIRANRKYMMARTMEERERHAGKPVNLLSLVLKRYCSFVMWDLGNLGCFEAKPAEEGEKTAIDVSEEAFRSALALLTCTDNETGDNDGSVFAPLDPQPFTSTLPTIIPGVGLDPAASPEPLSWMDSHAHLVRSWSTPVREENAYGGLNIQSVEPGTTWRCSVPGCTLTRTVYLKFASQITNEIEDHLRDHAKRLLRDWSPVERHSNNPIPSYARYDVDIKMK
ncbi:hypothetical protein HDU93_001095 [Gonapodya sp. JEL0774]|nr:hypothetical protein HDU93_001095 [Gonapodya sp. JEL0774]